MSPREMTLWEITARESCRDTIGRYTHSGDSFRLEGLAATFCEDGVLHIRGREPLEGRAAIIERLGGGRGGTNEEIRAQAKAQQAPGVKRIVRHNITNILFESVTPDEVRVASYFTVFTEIGPDHMGRYRDRFVPVGDTWLIAHRFVSIDWFAEGSTFRSVVAD